MGGLPLSPGRRSACRLSTRSATEDAAVPLTATSAAASASYGCGSTSPAVRRSRRRWRGTLCACAGMAFEVDDAPARAARHALLIASFSRCCAPAAVVGRAQRALSARSALHSVTSRRRVSRQPIGSGGAIGFSESVQKGVSIICLADGVWRSTMWIVMDLLLLAMQ